MEYLCKYCEISFKRKGDLGKHSLTIKCKEKQNKYHINEELNNNILKLQKELEQYKLKLFEQENKNKLQENKIEELVQENNTLKIENNTLKTEIKALEKASEGYRKIVEKAATKSTNTTVKNNYQHNNYLNYISSEPINFKNLKNQLKDIVTTQSVMYDDEDFHNHIVDNIFKDKNGKDKLLCTDINRKNFTYKDEKSGELISDPELERLREQLKKGTDIKLIRRNLLEKLVNEYEENGSIGIDPYKQFSDIIQKLNFGTPFVDHMAKKTYVKTKNTDETNKIEEIKKDNLQSDEFSVEIQNIDESFDEEEYQKLYEEFKEEL
jgi:hypothetical protein